MTLFINNEPAIIGKTYPDFRGEPLTLTGMAPPHKPSSTGRVYVTAQFGTKGEYFPSVIGGEWR